jgi:hypothetical protein
MAGKTFHGVGGNFDGETPPLDPDGAAPTVELEDGREPYSGPTVVDDAKIAESLKRLRSLDQPPPDTLIGVTAVVLDPPSSEPTRIADAPLVGGTPTPVAVVTPTPVATPTPAVTALPAQHPMATTVPGAPPISRPTAVGHNSVGSTTVIGQQNVYQLDPLRGTMFGHSIHLPDVNTPESAVEDLSSGQLVVVPRPTAEEMRPFLPGVTERSTRQAQQRPQLEADSAIPLPPQIEPMRRTELFHEPESETDIVSGARSRVRARTAFVVVLLAAAAGVAVAWIYSHNEPSPGATLGAPTAIPAPASPGLGTGPRPSAAATPAPPPPPPSPATAVAPPPAAPVPEEKSHPDLGSRPPIGEAEPARATPQSDDNGARHARRDRHRAIETAAATEAGAGTKPAEAKAEPAEAKAEPKPEARTEAKAEPKTEKAPDKAVEAKPTKPGKTKKHAEPEEDPDGTMGPSD